MNSTDTCISKFYVKEWIKWLTYMPDFKRNRIEEINKKRVDDLSVEDLNEILEYKKQEKMLELLKKVQNESATTLEYNEVSDFIDTESIEDLMHNKLTDKENEEAQNKVKRFYYFSDDEIIRKVENCKKKDNYDDLSMVDSYVFHIMSEVYSIIRMKKIDKELYSYYSNDNSKTYLYK